MDTAVMRSVGRDGLDIMILGPAIMVAILHRLYQDCALELNCCQKKKFWLYLGCI